MLRPHLPPQKLRALKALAEEVYTLPQFSEKLSHLSLRAEGSSGDHPVSRQLLQGDASVPPGRVAAAFPTFPFLLPSPLQFIYEDVSVIAPTWILISFHSISL